MHFYSIVLKPFFRLCWHAKKWYVPFLIFAILSGITFRLPSLFVKNLTDSVLNGNMNSIFFSIVLVVGTYLIAELLDNIVFYFWAYTHNQIWQESAEGFMQRMRNGDYSFHTSKASGKLISVFKRAESGIYTLLGNIHKNSFRILIGFLTTLVTVAVFDFQIAFILFFTLFVTIIGVLFNIRKNIIARNEVNRADDNISRIVVDNLIAFENVKYFGTEKYEEQRLLGAFSPLNKAQIKYAWTFIILDMGVGIPMCIGMGCALWLGAIKISNGSMSVGVFIMTLSFIIALFDGIFQLTYQLRDIAKSSSDLEDFFSYFVLENHIKDPLQPLELKTIKGNIHFQDVNFSFLDGKQVLQNITFEIHSGKTVALVGKSGAGKTTLSRLLLRLYDPSNGKILLDGVDIKNITQTNLRKNIGLVPQEATLFNESIGFNIGYAKTGATISEIIDAAKKAQLHEFISGLPEGYNTIVGERGIKLSGGQRQRLAIARVFLYNPPIIIFDEATSQLDSENEQLIQKAFMKLTENKTTIIIAHRLSTIMHADKIVVLEQGRVIEEGTHGDLLDKDAGLYQKLWNMQTDGIID